MPPEVRVRPAGVRDVEVAADLRQRTLPYLVLTAEGMRARLTEARALGAWLAFAGRTAVGFGYCRVPVQGRSRVIIVVPPEFRRMGAGSALLDAVTATVRGDAVSVSGVADEPDGLAFAEARGFTIGHRHSVSAVLTADVPPPAAHSDDVTPVPLSEVAPRAVWLLHQRVSVDDPSGMYAPQPYETWCAEFWSFPDHAADLGAAAVADGRLVAFTQVLADRRRGALWSTMTGVDRKYRGRGLARLVKAVSLAAAHEAGITHAYAANDSANAPMLAVNNWLGFRPTASARSVERLAGP